MPLYDFACTQQESCPLYEVRCSIADKDALTHPCPICGAPGRQVIVTAPHVNDPTKVILDYPGSKRLKAGYVHSHGDKGATKTQAGYGGMMSPSKSTHAAHPLVNAVIPDPVRRSKKT